MKPQNNNELLIKFKRRLKALMPKQYIFFKKNWYHLRYREMLTKLLGYKYRPNHNNIQIAVTFECNLGCINCDMSAGLAPSKDRMSLQQIIKFVNESIEKKRKWNIIAILGGEPAIHPQIFEIVNLILNYKKEHSPNTKIQFFTNGFNTKVKEVIKRLPTEIDVLNSDKVSAVQSDFTFFNMAPIDYKICRGINYSNACMATEGCGIGLTKYGYYPCIVAGGIDKVFGFDIGRKALPPIEDPMTDQSKVLCRYCGHLMFYLNCFLQEDKQKIKRKISRSWEEAYNLYKKNITHLSDY